MRLDSVDGVKVEGIDDFEEFENDYLTSHIINIFNLSCLSRKYSPCGFPLPLSVGDISMVLEAHPTPIPRSIIDFSVFSLDKEVISGFVKRYERQVDIESNWMGAVSAVNGY